MKIQLTQQNKIDTILEQCFELYNKVIANSQKVN